MRACALSPARLSRGIATSLFALAVALVSVSRRSGAQATLALPLPTSLTDAEFWQLVTTSSEPGGSFASDNFTSNEMAFPTIIDRLRAAGDTAGAYLGVGPEQNFSYIAALHPRIAFLVDIRRQSVMQHLMYKAIFELSSDRADFISLLFSKPRPAGLTEASSIANIWEAYWGVDTDRSRFAANLSRIVSRLRDTHGFALDSADLTSLRYVYQAFYELGPKITYNGYGSVAPYSSVKASMPIVPLPFPGNTEATAATLTGTVRDSATGTPVAGAVVEVVGSGAGSITSDSGVYRLIGLARDAIVSVEVIRSGFNPVVIAGIRLDRPLVTRDLLLPPMRAPTAIPLAPTTGTATRTYYGGTNFAALTAALDSAGIPGSFLATEERYRYMREMENRNLFIPVVGDFAGPKALRSVGDYLRAHGTPVTAFYVSNVEDYLFGNRVSRAFYDNVGTLPVTGASLFIRSGASLCPIGAFLAAVVAGRVTTSADAAGCVL
jgi:hypothetical protein